MPALVLYDGLCGFCHGTVQWLLKHDKRDEFRFTPQQSKLAQEVLLRHGLNRAAAVKNNSVYLVVNPASATEQLWQRSDFMVQALLILGGFWKVLGRLLQIMPRFVRDAGYRLVAHNRYRIAGRFTSCPIPSAAQRAKFSGLTDW